MTRDLLLIEDKPARRGFLRNLIAAPAASLATHRLILPAEALVTSPDPVFEAIERHKAAEVAKRISMERFYVAGGIDWSRLIQPDIGEHDELKSAASSALRDLLETAPTTREGAKALLKYISGEAMPWSFASALAAALLKSAVFSS